MERRPSQGNLRRSFLLWWGIGNGLPRVRSALAMTGTGMVAARTKMARNELKICEN